MKGWRKDNVQGPKIDPQVMKGWRKEFGPQRTPSPILPETIVFQNKQYNTILTKD